MITVFPHMARAHVMLGHYPVVISPFIPKSHVGDEIVPVQPSWLRVLVRRVICHKFPQGPVRFVRGAKLEMDQILEIEGKLFMTQAVYDNLVREMRK